MRRTIATVAGLMFGILGVAAVSWGQNAENTKRFDGQESAFLRDAVQEDIFMERLGQYAAEHAATEEVKRLGKQEATDHQADREQIQQLAKDHGLDLMGHDADLTPQQKTVYDRLITKAGKDFDKDYTKLAVAEHNRLIAEYQRERDHAADVVIREYAGRQVDGLKHHLQMSEDAQKLVWN
jgi:putative membrane protein